jgi:hypothetical protein
MQTVRIRYRSPRWVDRKAGIQAGHQTDGESCSIRAGKVQLISICYGRIPANCAVSQMILVRKSSRDGRTMDVQFIRIYRTGRFEVWKMPASGGAPLRITRYGGLTASELLDGRFLYYAKHDGSPTSIWRVPVGGREEKMIVDGLSYALNFVVSEPGLCFLALGNAPYKASIDFFEYATGKRTTLLKLEKQHWYGMA